MARPEFGIIPEDVRRAVVPREHGNRLPEIGLRPGEGADHLLDAIRAIRVEWLVDDMRNSEWGSGHLI